MHHHYRHPLNNTSPAPPPTEDDDNTDPASQNVTVDELNNATPVLLPIGNNDSYVLVSAVPANDGIVSPFTSASKR
jgi:hypothetical protein